jgi:sucrose phosphorylase
MNITYVDAMKNGCDAASHADRFIASQAIQLALPGIPAVYIHSLLGSRNWKAGVRITGRARSINRERLRSAAVCSELDNPNSFRARIFHPYCRMLQIRRRQPAFDPNAGCRILPMHKRVVAIHRSHNKQEIYTITNISGQYVKLASAGMPRLLRDLLTGRILTASALELMPFQSVWLTDP